MQLRDEFIPVVLRHAHERSTHDDELDLRQNQPESESENNHEGLGVCGRKKQAYFVDIVS